MPHVLVNGPASWNTLIDMDSLPVAGGPTLVARGHRDGLGGTSAGKALTLAALAVDVTLRTVLGEDEAATAVRRALARPRIEVLAVPAAAGRTERHLNLMTQDGQRQSIYLELPSPSVSSHPGPSQLSSPGRTSSSPISRSTADRSWRPPALPESRSGAMCTTTTGTPSARGPSPEPPTCCW